MKLKPLMTHEIGSLAKPSWRVKAFSGTPLNDHDIHEAKKWGERLRISDLDSLIEILSKKEGFSPADKEAILSFASLFATRLMESTGLDILWDGEQHRVEMYEYPIRQMTGFLFRGHVRSFDNKYYRKASCVDKPGFSRLFHVKEYEQISSITQHRVKIPVTGAYTLVDWSFDEYYIGAISPGEAAVRESLHHARSCFLTDVAKNVIYPNLQALCDRGAPFLQVDEPAATTKRGEIPEFISSLKTSIGDLAGKAFFSTHICFSDYTLLFPQLLELEGILDEVHFEYANRDTKELGVSAAKRTSYGILEHLRNTRFVVGLGVLDVHTDFIESKELVRDRILYACEIIKDPYRLFIAPDCGLRTRSWDVAHAKLCNLVEGRNLAAAALGIS